MSMIRRCAFPGLEPRTSHDHKVEHIGWLLAGDRVQRRSVCEPEERSENGALPQNAHADTKGLRAERRCALGAIFVGGARPQASIMRTSFREPRQ